MKKIADNVAMLELSVHMGERHMVIYPTLIWDEAHVVLVDTGYPGTLSVLRSELDAAGVSLESLTHVMITHQDFDHIGGLPEILKTVSHPIEVLAHELEKPYIQGEKLLIKHDPSRGEPPKATVTRTVADGEVLPFAGGLKVVYTPGHSPGHICLYHSASKTLIAGDATVANDGELLGPNEVFTPNMELAFESLGKVVSYDIDNVICYHGGLCDSNISEQLAKLVNRK